MLPILNKNSVTPVTRNSFFSAMDRLMDDVFSDGFALAGNAGKLNMYETGDTLYVEVEVPGMTQDELDLSLENNVLTIRAEQKEEEEKKDANYYIRERRRQQWARSIRLPINIADEKVSASFNNGVLKIEMEKAETAKAHKIEIK